MPVPECACGPCPLAGRVTTDSVLTPDDLDVLAKEAPGGTHLLPRWSDVSSDRTHTHHVREGKEEHHGGDVLSL